MRRAGAELDALDRYQDTSSKGGALRLVPRNLKIRLGPAVQDLGSSVLHRVHGAYEPPRALPGGWRRIYLFHVRKTAGTSLVRSFLALGGEDPGAVEQRLSASFLSRADSGPYAFSCGRGTLRRGDYFFGWSHAPSHRVELPPETATIALFRDPASRIVSYYRYLVAGDTTGNDLGWRVQADERAMAAGGFHRFLRQVPPELLLNQLYMFSKTLSVSEAVDNVLRCAAVMTTETFRDDLEKFALLFDLPLAYRRDRVTNLASVPLDDVALASLRDRLEPEYELLAALADAGRI